MNNEYNQPKQLNNFAKVIQVDKNGNPIPPKNNIEIVQKAKIKDENIVVKEHNPMITFYIVIILILIAILLGFIVFYVLPRL